MTPFPRRPESGVSSAVPDIVALAETDLLLDRLGDRSPYPDDLDDPLFAALAVLAADVDLDEVSPQRTRRTLAEHGLWPPQMDTGSVSAGRLIELTPVGPNGIGATVSPPGWTPESRAQALAAEARAAQLRRLSAFADPGRTVGIRLVPALAAAGAALVLSMGAAAALTSGQSVNPAKVIESVVQQFTGETGPASDAEPAAPGPAVHLSVPPVVQGPEGAPPTPPIGLSPSPSVSGLLPSPTSELLLSGDQPTGAAAPTSDLGSGTAVPLVSPTLPGHTHPTHDEHPTVPSTLPTTAVAPTPTPTTAPPDPSPAEPSPSIEESPTPSETTTEAPAELAPPPAPDAQVPPST